MSGPEGQSFSAFLPARYAPEQSSGFDSLLAPLTTAAAIHDPYTRSPKSRTQLKPGPSRMQMSPSRIDLDIDSPTTQPMTLPDPHQNIPVIVPPKGKTSEVILEDSAAKSHYPVETTAQTTLNHSAVPDDDAIEPIVMRPGSYSIRLVLDTREKPGLSSKKLETLMIRNHIPWEARALAMGDAIWIAQHHNTGLEVVLDCCLERKRLDDLLCSLKGEKIVLIYALSLKSSRKTAGMQSRRIA